MTLIDWILEAPIWLKIVLALIALYILTWMPRVISGFNKIIRLLNEVNKRLDIMNASLSDSLKNGSNARITADLIAKMLISNNKKEDKEKEE